MADASVPDLTVKPDGTVALPSDQDRLRRAFADYAGLDPNLALPEASDKMFNRVVTERRSQEAYNTQQDNPSDLDLALSRYVPIPQATTTAAGQPGALPMASSPETGTFGEGLVAGLRQSTLLGNLAEYGQMRREITAALGPIRPVVGYDEFQDPQTMTPEIRRQLWLVAGSQSPQETALRIRQYNQKKWDTQQASMSGGAFMFGSMVGGMIDPFMLAGNEVGIGARVSRAFAGAGLRPMWGALARGVELATINAAQSLAIEATHAQLDGSYVADGLGDALKLAAASGFGAGVLMGGYQRVMQPGERERALRWQGDGHFQQLLDSAPDDPLIQGQRGAVGSVGAAATPYMAASHFNEAMQGEGLKPLPFGLERLFNRMTPALRNLDAGSLIVRETTSDLVDLMGLRQNKNVEGAMSPAQKSAFPVESEIAVRWKAKASEVKQEIRASWLKARGQLSEDAAKELSPFYRQQLSDWLKGDGRLTWNDFNDRVGKAVANGNVDKLTDAYSPQVEHAARQVDGLLKAHSKEAQGTGLFKHTWDEQIKETRMELAAATRRGEDTQRIGQLETRLAKMTKLAEHGPQSNTSPNFFPRMYRQDQMVAQEARWHDIIGNWMKRGGATDEEARLAGAATHAEITRSIFRPVFDDNGELIKEARLPGSAKFRTLEVPDEEIADFLDWNATSAVDHQTATMAPAIELARRYDGDPSMKAKLQEIQSDYQRMISESTDGHERVRLQDEMKRALDDTQALRDRLLNVAGASKDPHSWNERTIRLLKHYTAWTTLGGSAISQMGDLFRPVMTEGLDAVHRYGFMTLIDGSRAEVMKMVRRERMMSGDAWELETASNSLSFSNIGDQYHSRSAIERRANQFSGAYFMLNGLNWATDFTKNAASLVIQGNLNHEIMSWARAVRAEAAAGPEAPLPSALPGGGVGFPGKAPPSTPPAEAVSSAPLRHTADFDQFMQGNRLAGEQGRPVVGYHGTTEAYGEYDPSRVGSATGQGMGGTWFSASPEEASGYAAGPGGNVRPAYLRMANPKIVQIPEARVPAGQKITDAELPTQGLTLEDEVAKARAEGHDGVIFKAAGNQSTYVVFDTGSQVRHFDQRYDLGHVAPHAEARLADDLQGTPAGEQMASRGLAEHPDFTRFMKDNALTDEAGQPVMMFHGTNRAFEDFEGSRTGKRGGTRMGSGGQMFWFTMDPDQASTYAVADKGGLFGARGEQAPNVRPVYLRATNPLNITDELVSRMEAHPAFAPGTTSTLRGAMNEKVKNGVLADLMDEAKAKGHDAVILDSIDNYGQVPKPGDKPTRTVVVFDKDQIRPFSDRYDVAKATSAAPPDSPPVRPSAMVLERLHGLSIDANDALAIADQLERHGVPFNSIHMANSDEWTDKDAQKLYRGAISRALNTTVTTPGAADRPTWVTNSVGSLIAQFKTFGMSSTIRTLYAGLQSNDRQFWTGAAVAVGAGVVLNELRNQLMYDKSSFDQPYLGVLADGLDRSGVLGSMMDVNNAIETATNNKVGLRPLVGAGSNTPVSAQKFADTFFGPAAGKASQAAKTLGEVMSGNATARTWRDMRGFVPGQNLPYLDPIADKIFPRSQPQPKGKAKQGVPAA